MRDADPLHKAIRALEGQRALLGDAVVNTALAPLREQLAQLESALPRSGEQVLKQVSVLFLDVVGSTTLAQQLDPEEVSDVMDGCLQRCTEVVLAHGGKVLQYAGDSLLAAFGAETAREDDAERAVRAGLALLALGRRVGDEVRARHDHAGFDVRVGVHTGSVLLGGGVDEGGTIRGIAVNIAARMEQTAPAGALRISHDSYALVRGIFDVQAQAPLPIKGVDAPVASYLVQRAKPRAFHMGTRGIEQTPTPLTGRDGELARLTTALEQVIASRRPQSWLLVAQAGLGKSRLLRELLHHAELLPQACWLLLGRCHPSSELEPYGLLRAMLTWRLDIADSDSAELARRKLVDGLLPWLTAAGSGGDEARVDALCLGHLIGFDFAADPLLAGVLAQPRRLRERGLAAVTHALQGLAGVQGSPIVMLLEDLHWADDASLDWLQGLLQSPPDLPLLLVMSARPSLFERRADWSTPPTPYYLMMLSPLPHEQRNALTATLLRRLPNPPAALLELIDHHAEGNPFYAEELVKMLLDQGVLAEDERAPGRWRLHQAQLRPDRVPGTLTGVLQARLDALAADERHALQMASVIGPVFWDDALATLAPTARAAIDPLQRKAMVLQRPQSRFEDTAERSFHHHLLHQVTYGTVLKAARQEGHARAAAWLQARAGDRSDEILAITAEHFERAGDPAQAFNWYARASEQARERDALLAALTYCERALAQPTSGNPRERIEVIIRQADSCDALGRYAEMGRLLDQALQEIELIGAKDLRLKAVSSKMLLADRLGDVEGGWALALDLAAAAEAADSPGQAALAWGNLAWISKTRGQFELAREQVARGLVWAREGARRRPTAKNPVLYEVQLLQVEASIHDDAFDDDRCEQALRASLESAETLASDARARANAHLHLGLLALRRIDLAAAASHLRMAEQMTAAIPVPRTLHACRRELANLQLMQGDAPAAAALAAAAAASFEALGAQIDTAHCWLVAAQAHRQLGHAGDAAEACRRAVMGFEAGGGAEGANGARCARLLLAASLQSLGNRSEALTLVHAELDAETAADAPALNPQTLAARMAAWSVLVAHADPRAPDMLEKAWSGLQRHLQRRADPLLRARMRDDVPLHREIAAAWQTWSTGKPRP
jgi:class 3 adenylate cyclase